MTKYKSYRYKGTPLLSKRNKARLVWDIFAVALGFVAYHIFNACKCQKVQTGEYILPKDTVVYDGLPKEASYSDINHRDAESCLTCGDNEPFIT